MWKLDHRQPLGLQRLQRPGPAERIGDDLDDVPPAAGLPDGLLDLGDRHLVGVVTLGPLPHLDGVEVRCLRYRPGQQRRGVVGELTVERDDRLGAVRDRLAGRQAIPYTGR